MAAAKQLLSIKDYTKQYKMVKVLLEKLFQVKSFDILKTRVLLFELKHLASLIPMELKSLHSEKSTFSSCTLILARTFLASDIAIFVSIENAWKGEIFFKSSKYKA